MNESVDRCLICESDDIRYLVGYEAKQLLKCRKCRFVFQKRIPTQKELKEHYVYGMNHYLSPITIKRYNEILDSFEKYRKNGRLLDVGCGIGHFLGIAKARGWEVYGTEYATEAIQICRGKGITMHEGAIDPKNYQPEFFDIIVSIEVIEHINTPRVEIGNFKKVLIAGGILYFTTPNFNSLTRLILKSKWDNIAYPDHLSYYTPSSIQRILEEFEFKKLNLQTTGVSLTHIRISLSVSDQAYVSPTSDDERIRAVIHKSKSLQVLKNLTNAILSLTGTGDTIKGVFQKAD